MILKIYSIHDQAAQAFITPFFMHNKALAIRAFSDNINSKEENNISKHPEQYSLFCLGEYDDIKGTIDAYQKPEIIATAIELVEEKEEIELIKEIKSLKTILLTEKRKDK